MVVGSGKSTKVQCCTPIELMSLPLFCNSIRGLIYVHEE
jgi:hypothetical protein